MKKFLHFISSAALILICCANVSAQLTLTVSKTNATTGCNGTATANASGGVAPYSFSWSNGRNGTFVDSLCSGTYSVIVTDSSNVSDTASFVIAMDTTTLTVSVSTVGATGGNCNGNATATVSGGTAPYSYSWSNGGNGTFKDSLCSGTYTIIVTDINGINDSASFTITSDTTALNVSVSTVGATGGNCNGNATATVSGGTAPYTYSWSNGGNGTFKDSLCSGTYTIIVTDINGINDSASFTITSDTTALNVSVSTVGATGGNCNGNATATVSGGTAPYTYSWSNGGNGTFKDSLCSGTYTIIVTDINGVNDSASFTITSDTTALTVSVSTVGATGGNCNGNATATVSGGTAPYTYSWSNGGNGTFKDSLCSGTYTIIVTDINGLNDSASFTITSDTTALNVSVSTVGATGGNCNGNATATVSGGTAPYSYSWSNGGNGTFKDSLCSGTYTIIVTDINGLNDSASFTITSDTTALTVSVSTVGATGGNCNGNATATVSGGTAPYSYSWSNGGNGTFKDSLCSGTYTLIVTDINGLNDSASFTITTDTINPCTAFAASISSTLNQTFPGACDGIASSTVSNGTMPFQFNWGTGLSSTAPQFSGLCSGSFTLTVTDANGCSTTATGSVGTDSIVGPCNGVVINVGLNTTIASPGLCDGGIVSTVAGGTAPYLFIWSNGYHTSNLSNACPGYYNVQVQDAIGCLGATSVFVQGDTSVPVPLMINITTNDVDSIGACNGSAHVNATGGDGTYSIVFSNGFSGGQVNNLCAGYYTAYVTDADGVSDSISFVIGSPENTFINNNQSDPLNDSVIVATLTSDAVLSCGIDLATIDSIAVTSYYLGNNDSIVVIWTIYSIVSGDSTMAQIYGTGSDGVYEVVLSLYCDGRSAFGFSKAYGRILVNNLMTGIETDNAAKTKTVVYPNPFTEKLNISFVLVEKEKVNIKLFNSLGQVIYAENEQYQEGQNKININTENIKPGVYFFQLTINNQTSTTKIVK